MLVITITDTMHSYIIEERSFVPSFPKNSKEKQPMRAMRVVIVAASNVICAKEVVKSLGLTE